MDRMEWLMEKWGLKNGAAQGGEKKAAKTEKKAKAPEPVFVNKTPKGQKKGKQLCVLSTRPVRAHGCDLRAERRRGRLGRVVGSLWILQ